MIVEPLYILLASLGHPDSHEVVRKLTIKAEKKGKTLRQILKEQDDVMKLLITDHNLTPKAH